MDPTAAMALDAREVLRGDTLAGLRRVRDVTSLLAQPGVRARVEHALMAQPVFADAYRRRATRPAGDGAAGEPWMPDAFGAVQRDFLAWYGLTSNFFPAPFVAGARPLEFAACLLARDHDAYHVLCGYETSDLEEIALQSFLCAQAPLVFAGFVDIIARCPRIGGAEFKHLRDLLDADLDRAAMRRGRDAEPLVTADLAALADVPVSTARRALAIAPRATPPSPTDLRNTCGGRPAAPYFVRARAEVADRAS